MHMPRRLAVLSILCTAHPLSVARAEVEPVEALRERILDFLGVPEQERDSELADRLVEEELTLREKRALRSAAADPGGQSTGASFIRRSAWLPRVTVAASARSAPARREIRALAFADFPLGPPERTRAPAAMDGANQPPAPAPSLPQEPGSICLTVASARAVARAQADPERLRDLGRRARRSAWLPELRLRAERRLGRNESLDLPALPTSTLSPLGLDTSNDVRYEARATWDLARLVFSAEEIAAEAQALRVADMRREIESACTRLYFERRRLAGDSRFDPVDPAAQARRALRMQEIAAELDVLSGGAFTACVAAAPGMSE